ncbi:MAG: cell wall hydrolase [Sphingomonadaceae bacterium]|nr:cell wall hydrolase [Sphingomonadaceae bacterium]
MSAKPRPGYGPILSVVTALLLALGVVLGLALAHSGADRAGQLNELPGLAGEAPLFAVPPSLSDMDAARAKNAAVPFVQGPVTPAARFAFRGEGDDRSRATECLALAAMAEAGPSDTGQRAVIQVILNRVRHPAFAKTVCGVVFQGAERATGCQFTFTCDGSLIRRYSESAWMQARLRAGEALGGYVFKPVGLSTHYHTDWVYPYWSPQLDKLAKIETHLFFRWRGFWGTKPAFSASYRGGEPDPAALFGAIGPVLTGAVPIPTAVPDAPKIDSGTVVMRATAGKANFILLNSSASGDALAAARAVCNQPGTCRVLGWTDPAAIPQAFPIPAAARAALQFSYSRDPGGAEIALYGCGHFKGVPREQCIPRAR